MLFWYLRISLRQQDASNSDVTTPQATATKTRAYFKAFAPGLALVRLIPTVLGVVLRTILVPFARGLPGAKWFALFLAVCFVRAILRRDLQTSQGGSRRYWRLNEDGWHTHKRRQSSAVCKHGQSLLYAVLRCLGWVLGSLT